MSELTAARLPDLSMARAGRQRGEEEACGMTNAERLPPLRTPLCPAGHLPLKGGDQPAAPPAPFISTALTIGGSGDASQSPPLRGRCPAGQRGVRRGTER